MYALVCKVLLWIFKIMSSSEKYVCLFAFLPCCGVCGSYFPEQIIKPMSPAVEAHNLSYWTTRNMYSCSSIFFECEQLTVICFIFSSVLCAQSDKKCFVHRDIGKISGNHDKCRNGVCFLLIRENS